MTNPTEGELRAASEAGTQDERERGALHRAILHAVCHHTATTTYKEEKHP